MVVAVVVVEVVEYGEAHGETQDEKHEGDTSRDKPGGTSCHKLQRHNETARDATTYMHRQIIKRRGSGAQ